MSLTNKEINKLIHTKIYNDGNIYDLMLEFRPVETCISLEKACAIRDFAQESDRFKYAIVTSRHIPDYCGDEGLAMELVKYILSKAPSESRQGFMLTFWPGEGWKATLGDVSDCIECYDEVSEAKAMALVCLKYTGNLK